MFAKLFCMFMAVLLLALGGVGLTTYANMRNRQIDARLKELKKQAREIAYLASQNTASAASYFFGSDTTTLDYLNWKAAGVYDDFGAYILVVDRRGQVMTNLKTAYVQDPGFVTSLNQKDLNDALTQVLGGSEISVRAMVDGAPTFTVGVPFVQDGQVLGAVLIQTKAQTIEGEARDLLPPMLIVGIGAAILAALMVFFYTRRLVRPLTSMAEAAGRMAEGQFDTRVQADQTVPEVGRLADSFNAMAEKLSELENSRREFVANVSHELRSPITSIRGFVEGMEDGTIPPEEHGKYLSIVADETKRLSKLINDLLALSRLERDDATLQCTDFDMNEMLRRAVIRRMNDLDRKRMEVEPDFRLDPCMVHADSDRMEQVVVNLLDNAIKFTPEGGKIRLTTEDSGDLVTVTVWDNGPGILPEDRGKVFDRFFTADRAHTAGKGTGLGLSICKRIMEFHGQSLRLLDTAEGTAFAFTLEKAKNEDTRKQE